MAQPSPVGAVLRGLAAGAAGTKSMTAYQELVAKLRRQDDESQPESWDDAPAPAQVAMRILTGVFQKPVQLDQAERLTNVMHWSYGTGWGAIYGIIQGTAAAPTLRAGAVFGAGVWAMSYVQLVPTGIYQPPWKYPPKEIALDLSYHLVYGISVALAFAALTRH
jgi:hypothetical protein